MVHEFLHWLGPARSRWLAGLLVGIGISSLGLLLAFPGRSWLFAAQMELGGVFLAGAGIIVTPRLSHQGQQRLWLTLGPILVLVSLGWLVPDRALCWGGAGLGWIIVVQWVLRSRVRMEYQSAVRHLRRNEYAEAIAILDRLVQTEPGDPEHRRFRAELYRLSGDGQRACDDYEQIIRLVPGSPVGYTGLAEVYAQQGDYEKARGYALDALARNPHHWMAMYHLGMIEDRLGDTEQALAHLQAALAAGIPHSRYRLLTRLWLARNYYRQGQVDAARQQLDLMRRQKSGLKEWQVILASDQAAALRSLLEPDVCLAQRLFDEETALEVLGGTPNIT